MVVLRRVVEGSNNLTQSKWNEIKRKLSAEASKRNLKLDKDSISLNGFSICDKKDVSKCVSFTMDLLNTSAGEVEIKSGGKTWKMGETQVRDRKSGGTKKPEMDAQVANILDYAEYQIKRG